MPRKVQPLEFLSPMSAKVEIVIDDMVIRTAVDLEHLPQVIRAVRASR